MTIWKKTLLSQASSGAGEWFTLYHFQYNSTESNTQISQAVVDSSGTIYGISWDNSLTRAAFAVLDSAGDVTTAKYLNPNDGGTNSARSAAIDSSDNFIISGNDSSAAFLEKFNSSLTSQWAYEYTDPYAYFTPAEWGGIVTDSSDNIYFCGSGFTNTSWNSMVFFKLNSSGTIQWRRYLGTSSQGDLAFSLGINSAGTKIGFGGRDYQGGIRNCAFGVLNASDGTVDWSHSYYGTSTNSAYQNAFDSSGNLIVIGHQRVGTVRKGWVGKFNSSGAEQWTKGIQDSSYNTYAYGMCVDADDNTYMGIQVSGQWGGIIKLDSSGAKVWDIKIEGATGSDYTYWYPRSLTIDSDGFLIVAGMAYLPNATPSARWDSMIMRTTTDGPPTGTYGDLTFSTAGFTVSTGGLQDQGSVGDLGQAANYGTTSRPTTLTNMPVTSTTTEL